MDEDKAETPKAFTCSPAPRSLLQLLPPRPWHLIFPWSQIPVVFHGPFPGMDAASGSHGSGCSPFLNGLLPLVLRPCRSSRPRSDREYTVLESSLASWRELISSFVAFITQYGTSLAGEFVCLGHYDLMRKAVDLVPWQRDWHFWHILASQ